MNIVSVAELMNAVREFPGITTPEIAEKLNISVTYARWAVIEIGTLEFYDGNHVRFKAGVK